jgi:hypothetical protein
VNGVPQLIDFISGRNVADPDWAKLADLAGATLTIGILADRALARETEIPGPIRDLFIEVRERSRRRNDSIRAQFSELLDCLNAIGIEPIPMKGLARLLGSPAGDCRLLSDIDIMVPADRRDDCAAAMRRLGYVETEQEDGLAPVVFARSSDVGSVDLHTRLKPRYLNVGYPELARLSSPAKVGSGTSLMPSPTCQALILIAHDQLHDADYWRGLVDVRHLLDLREIADEGVDWASLASFFPAGSCRRALEIALLTASSFGGADVPRVYCGGAGAKLQVGRRRLQARFPFLQPLLTLLTIAGDPPPVSRHTEKTAGWSATLQRRWSTYLRPGNPGKSGARVVREAVDVR